MAKIIAPDGGFYVEDTEFTVDYANHSMTLKNPGSAGGGDYLPTAGGQMDQDAVIVGDTSLEVSVGAGGIRIANDQIELSTENSKVDFSDVGINLNSAAILGVNSVSGGSAGVALESEVDMNNHKITGLSDPTDPQDAMTKKKSDATYALKTAIPTNATKAKAGVVKQGVAVPDASGSTPAEAISAINALLASLRTAGVIANS